MNIRQSPRHIKPNPTRRDDIKDNLSKHEEITNKSKVVLVPYHVCSLLYQKVKKDARADTHLLVVGFRQRQR